MTRKRLLLWIGLPLLLLLLAGALLYGFRREAAAWLIDRELAHLGLEGSRYRIVELDADQALFADLTLPDGRIAAQQFRATYDLAELMQGRLRRVEITGLRVAPNAVAELLQGGGGGGGLPTPLPELQLIDAKVGVWTDLGTVSLAFDLTADAEGSDLDLRAWLADPLKDFQAERSSLALTATGELPSLPRLLDGAWQAEDLRLAGDARLTVENLTRPEEVERLDLELPLTWSFDGETLEILAAPQEGPLGNLKLPDFEAGHLSLQPGQLARLRPRPEGFDLTLTPDLRFATDSGAWVTLRATILAPLDPAFAVESLTLAPLALAGERWLIDEHDIERFVLEGELTGTWQALAGPLDLQLQMARTEIGRFPVEDLSLAGPFLADLTPEGLALTLAAPSRVTAGQAYDGTAALLPQGLEAEVEQTKLTLDWADSLRLTHSTTVQFGQQRAGFGTGKDALSVTGDFGRLEVVGETYEDFVYGGTLHLVAPSLTLTEVGLTLQGTDLTWSFPPPGEAASPARLEVAQASLTTGMGRLSGMTFQGEILERESGLTLTGKGRGPGGAGTVTVTLTDGGLSADWGPVTFKPKGFQPGSVLSSLKDFKDVSGTLKAALKLTWGEKSSSLMTLTLGDLTFTHPQARVEGLNGSIALDRLAQLSTRPAKLTARSVDPGLPMTDLTATLRIKPGRHPTYQLSDLAFTLAGGRFTLPALDYSEGAEAVSGTLSVEGLDLAALGRELSVEDLSLEGRMNGRLPVTFVPSEESVAITGGSLTATGPGVIRYGKPGTASLRAGGDSNFALALQALEDFRFNVFDIGLDKEADGRTRLALRLEGHNPSLLDGYPFRLNINLQTDLSQVLAALREGYRLNPNLFKGGWTFQ